MKKNILTTALSLFFILSLNAKQETEHFYYYQDERIFLQQRADKVFVMLAPAGADVLIRVNQALIHNP